MYAPQEIRMKENLNVLTVRLWFVEIRNSYYIYQVDNLKRTGNKNYI